MSGYLNRLIQRTQTANASQSLRPLVRSASPIAEHDQRLGVAGFEGAERGASPLADVNTDLDLGQATDDPALMTPDITALSDITVQRKMAGSGTPTTAIASNPSPVSVPGASDRPSATVRADRNSPLGFSGRVPPERLTPRQGDRSDRSTASLSPLITGEFGSQSPGNNRDRPMDAAEQQPPLPPLPLRPPMRAAKIPAIAIETNRMAETDLIFGIPPWEMPSPIRPSVRDEEINRLNDLRPEASLTRSQSTIPRLEPFTQSLDRDERWLEGGPVSTIDRHDPPQIVIGRITVEVISQTAIATMAAPSRSGPLTAASMSVIGPLGGGVSSHLRLSLRQR